MVAGDGHPPAKKETGIRGGWLSTATDVNVERGTMDKFYHERKYPVHPNPVEKWGKPIVIFVTVCTKNHRTILAEERIHQAMRSAWTKADAWKTGYYMIMPDHAHWFCAPGIEHACSLKRWIKYWKRLVTQSIVGFIEIEENGNQNQRNYLWQFDAWDTQIRDESHYAAKLEYVRNNLVRKGLVTQSEEWKFQGYIQEQLW